MEQNKVKDLEGFPKKKVIKVKDLQGFPKENPFTSDIDNEIFNYTRDEIGELPVTLPQKVPSERDIMLALRGIPSTRIPISVIKGKTYYYMCKGDIVEAIYKMYVNQF